MGTDIGTESAQDSVVAQDVDPPRAPRDARQEVDRPREWRSNLAAAVGGVLLFEILSGLAIYLLPFSLTNQALLLVHTVFGLLLVLPFMWYQFVHWRTYRHYPMTHTKLTGYLGLALSAVCLVSGLVLTYQALFASRITYLWDETHLLSTFGVVGFVVPHIVLLIWRDRRAVPHTTVQRLGRDARVGAQRRWVGATALASLGGFVAVGAVLAAYEAPHLEADFPEDYNFIHGEDRPFAPSLARTASNWAIEPRSLAGSETCGTSGCHEAIVEEWEVSAHRWSAMDPAFQTVQQVMAEQNGAESTRYCGGCHDPISLFSGAKNVFSENLTALHGYNEGVSCLVCHGVRETDLKGNANYILDDPQRYMYEIEHDETTRVVRDFLIRAYPRYHVDSLGKRMFKTPEYCAACHKQFIDEEVNNVGWVQLQNQYDNWRKSSWNHEGEPEKTIECRECHMPLVDSEDPAAGDVLDYNRTADDGMHRSHRFIASNQMIPALLDLPGAEEQIELTEQWLRGEFEVPEIADKWATGPAVILELVAPETAAPGEEIPIKVVITSNKVGHDFPTGPLDIIQSWIELTVTTDDGRLVFQSGAVDEDHFIQKGSFMFKAEGVDQYGNLIDRHNLWEMVGVRFRRSLFPGFSDTAEYTVLVPSDLEGRDGAGAARPRHANAAREPVLHVTARLRYRKFDQFLLNFLYGEDAGLTAPITDMTVVEGTVAIDAG